MGDCDDLEHVEFDINTFNTGLICLGFKDDEIISKVSPDSEMVEQVFQQSCEGII